MSIVVGSWAHDLQKKLCYVTNERTPSSKKWCESDLIVNSCLEAMATESTKVNILGAKLQVIEVKELKFDIYF